MDTQFETSTGYDLELALGHGEAGESEGERRVLVADSSGTVRKILRHLMTSLGWEVIEAQDGEEALEAAQNRPLPHAILLDLKLPKVDGFEVCRQLKQNIESKLISIIALTASDSNEEKTLALEAGVDELISKPVNRAELTVRLRSLLRIHRFNQELIGAESVAMALARAVSWKDGYSSSHVETVANYAVELGEAVGLEAADLKILRYGAILHNVGKISIPDAILEKTGPLSPREKALFQQLPRVGCDICSPLNPIKPVLPIIRHHKEHWDGTGYPDGLRGDQIPLGAQIVGLVDVYAALTSNRPYRQAISHQQAITELRRRAKAGRHDPKLVERFVEQLTDKFEEDDLGSSPNETRRD